VVLVMKNVNLMQSLLNRKEINNGSGKINYR
jgi:hypothetical protein